MWWLVPNSNGEPEDGLDLYEATRSRYAGATGTGISGPSLTVRPQGGHMGGDYIQPVIQRHKLERVNQIAGPKAPKTYRPPKPQQGYFQ